MKSQIVPNPQAPEQPGRISDQSADVAFKRIVVSSTALGFAVVLGAAACLERGVNHGFDFHWHWRAVLGMGLGVAAAIHLWRLVWRVEEDDTARTRARLARFCGLLLVATALVFVYPITFVSSEHIKDVLYGLSFAAAVLTFVGWMIWRVVRGFSENDATNAADKNS